MIQDAVQDIAATPSTTVGIPDGACFGLDLNPDFGNGQYPRKAGMISQSGEDWMLHCQVVNGFTAGTGTPFLQVHAVLSDTGAFGAAFVNGPTSNYVAIGSALAPRQLDGATEHWGFSAAQLTAGTDFYIRMNPWTAAFGYDIAGATLDHKNLRYLGIVLFTANYTTDAFGLDSLGLPGTITARLVKSSDIAFDAPRFAYPSAVRHV